MKEQIIEIRRKHARAELDELRALCERAIQGERWAEAAMIAEACMRAVERLE